MNEIFDDIPILNMAYSEYDCGNSSYMLKYDGVTADAYKELYQNLLGCGFSLFQENSIRNNLFATFIKNKAVYIWYCESERVLRLTAEKALPEINQKIDLTGRGKTAFFMFEVDHSLIDCGMCLIIRTRQNRFFVIDSAHMYSVNDDIRIIEFLKKVSGEEKPTVEGWFFSHAHEDHIDKFLDILKYHQLKI